jgi:hypothetical protein
LQAVSARATLMQHHCRFRREPSDTTFAVSLRSSQSAHAFISSRRFASASPRR